jgi:hypothetical protein
VIFLSTAGGRKAGGLGELGFQAFGLDVFGFLAGGLAPFLRGEGGDPLVKLLGSKGVGFRHGSWRLREKRVARRQRRRRTKGCGSDGEVAGANRLMIP